MAQLEHIEAIERRLWSAADTLRANSNFAANEFFMPVMGLPSVNGCTTQQTTQRMLLKLMPAGNMRNILSLVMKNPKINIAGLAHVLGLSQNGIKYHIKQMRTKNRIHACRPMERWPLGDRSEVVNSYNGGNVVW